METEKNDKVVDIKKDKTEEPIKEVTKVELTKGQGAKLIIIATQKAVFVEMIEIYKMNLAKLVEKEKTLLEAFDVPTNKIKFDEKTFEVEY